MDILDKLVKTIEYMGKSHDFNESTSMLYVFDAINEIKELRTKLAEREADAKRKAITYKDALNGLTFYLNQQPDLAWSWHCNLAMMAVDSGASHLEANIRTADFMLRAFEVDIQKLPEYQAILAAAPINASPNEG